MLTAQDNATLARAHYDAYNRRDFDKGLSMVSDDVKWTNVAFDVTFTGRKGYREYLENWSTAMPDSKVEITKVIHGDEWTTVEFIGRGTHTGPLMGPQGTISATQKKVDLKCCELLRINDGQIVEARVYFDGATLLRQLGLMPQTPVQGQPVASAR
jgi:steroid delta-isomerase-like uncharacterized protein